MPKPPPDGTARRQALIRAVAACACLLFAASARSEDSTPALTTAAGIRSLSVEAAAGRPRATLRAAVTFTASWGGAASTTVQDDTAGVFVELPNASVPHLHFGDLVEMRGHVEPGRYVPNFAAEEVRIVGRKEPPPLRTADWDVLRGGALDSQFVELEGVVRQVQPDANVIPPSTVLTLAIPSGRAEVYLALLPADEFSHLVDCRVRVRGVVFSYFNARRQAFGFRIMACDRGELEILSLPPALPFTQPPTAVRSLLQFDPHGPFAHRVRVQGVVNLHWPGEFLFLQDGNDGLLVRSRDAERLRPGDVVDVLAFPEMGAYAAELEDASVRIIGRRTPPAPVMTPLTDLVSGRTEGRLVQTEAELDGIADRAGRSVLILRQGNVVVPAELPEPVAALSPLRKGSIVRVTGICQVDVGSLRRFAAVYQPESAHLLLRSVDDIVVLRAAPWWTPGRMAAALGALGCALTLALTWASSLQRRNHRLRAEIAARERAEAEVRRSGEERSIVAADLHDSLEQSLTGVALQLRAARDALDSGAGADQTHLTIAERLLEHSRIEVHRAVRDLRHPSDEPLDLPAALRDLVRLSNAGAGQRVQLELPESLPAFGGRVGYHLLHLAQEGVTNALKHSDARSITVALRVSDRTATVEVRDDGKGFDPDSRPGPTQGHFGLQGMKERTARLNGSLRLHSSPGRGVRVEAVIPLPA